MKDIVNFINESVEIDVDDYLSQSIGIPRNRMPQLPKEHFDTFLMHFSNKYNVKKMKVCISKLKPIQNEVNIDKVKSIIDDDVDDENQIFFVSKEYGLVDGTHRHLASLSKDPTKEVNIYRTNLSSKKTIEILNKMKHSFNKGIDENF